MSENSESYWNTDCSGYVGGYVVFVGGKLFAHGDDGDELLRKAWEGEPGETPFIAKVAPLDSIGLFQGAK